MKKELILLAAILMALVSSCSKDDDEPTNKLVGTSWTAPDDIASFLYGDGCTTTVEFLTNTECQELEFYPRGFHEGTEVFEGTYTIKGDSVFWTANEHDWKGKISGSVIVTTMKTMSGGFRTYIKN